MRPLLAALALALLLVLPVTALTVWQTGTAHPASEYVLKDLIQAEHVRVCGKSLTYTNQLSWAARYKAADMGFRDRMSHAFVDGARIWDFYDHAGIAKPYGAGEVLAVNTYPDADSPAVAFRGWLDSPGHRAILRNCDYDRFGVGSFKTGAEKWWAAEFTNTVRP